jgi:hypothetical protein
MLFQKYGALGGKLLPFFAVFTSGKILDCNSLNFDD